MKTIKIANFGVLGNKFIATFALAFCMCLSSTNYLFGQVSIELASGSNPDCTGSVSVEGWVLCDLETKPVVTVINSACSGDSYTPSEDVSWYGDTYYWWGTWGPQTIILTNGVNVITASESECDGDDAISIPSNGGSGSDITYSQGATYSCGFASPNTIYCLEPTNMYFCYESYHGYSGNCGEENLEISSEGTNVESDINGTIVLPDQTYWTCPGSDGYSPCISSWILELHAALSTTPTVDVVTDISTRSIDAEAGYLTVGITSGDMVGTASPVTFYP